MRIKIRHRLLLCSLALAATGTGGFLAFTWGDLLGRWHIQRLRSKEPAIRGAAAASLTSLLPHLRPGSVRFLAQALEGASGGAIVASGLVAFHPLVPCHEDRVGFYEIEDLLAVHPDFWAPAGSSFGDGEKLSSPPSRWALPVEVFLEWLKKEIGETRGISVLNGRLAARVSPGAHYRITKVLCRLRARIDLFNAVFDPAKLDWRAASVLVLFLEDPTTSLWLRECALGALGTAPPLSAVSAQR